MRSAFISYSVKDEAKVIPYENQLKNLDIAVWRDQSGLRQGQLWPMRLGEAIAKQEVFLLFWSVNAAESHFVTLEWNTAIALKKTIIPVLLDDKPLPNLLRPYHGFSDISQLSEHVLSLTPTKEPPQNPTLLKELKSAKEDAGQALDIVKHHIQQHIQQDNWRVGGNVYQVQGDLHIVSSGEDKTSWLNRQLTAEETYLYGRIITHGENDEETPLANISIFIEQPADLNSRDTSTSDGKFKLRLSDKIPSGESIILAIGTSGDQAWAMLYPYRGKVRIPQRPEKDPIKVVLLPADSHKLKSAAEMRSIIQEAAAKQALQQTLQPEAKEQSWQQQLAKLAKAKGIPEQQFLDDVNAFVSDVLARPDDYDSETRAYAEYANKNFSAAEKRFAALAEAQKQRREKQQQALQETEKKLVSNLRMAGLSAYDDRRYTQAIKHYQQALAYLDKKKRPGQWAELQRLIADAHGKFAAQTEGQAITQHFAEAAKAYEQTLTVYTREQLPQDWAMTQNNLGLALQEQGIRSGGEAGQTLLGEAVGAYRAALTVYTREQLPQQWAMTQNNLGGA